MFSVDRVEAEPSCAHYSGYASVETKLGNARDITEGAAFLPVTCDETRLIFSDVRFKGDNLSNREGNLGLGARFLKDEGIIGAYGYFDRKKSGVTDKYHNQVTLGAEYLAQNWEVRANGYIPASGKKTIGSPGAVSDPFLSGTGIFVNQVGGIRIEEEGMHGGDIEAGWHIPAAKTWLHGAVYAFHGDDAPVIEGARARASYQLTDHISLLAEGQYDAPRGRQGWVGARLTIPFNRTASRPQGLSARMTAAPVRDVDIVTTAKPIATTRPTGTYAVTNADSGTAQRVIYVDNSNTDIGGGVGSLENPFTTLAAAQAAMQDNDIVYVASGLGDATGMDSGFLIDRANVLLLGEGSAFVYDDDRLTVGNTDFDGIVLRPAGAAPVITNVNTANLDGDGLRITATGAKVAGVTIDGAARHGVHVTADSGLALSDVAITNLTARNATADGIRIEASGVGSDVTATLSNITASDNHNGLRFYARDDASVTADLQSSVASSNTQHGVIVYDDSAAGSVDVDLGGGGRSEGNNALTDNILEDLAVDIDGGTLSAQNNWWGQAGSVYQQAPDGFGSKPQIYYGAPLSDDLAGHWTFDSEWLSATEAFDRSGNGHNGALNGSIAVSDVVAAQHGEGLNLNNDNIQITGLTEISNAYSAFAWVRPDTTAWAGPDVFGHVVFANSPLANGNFIVTLALHQGEVSGFYHQSSTVPRVTTGANITNGDWHNVGVSSVRSGATSVYVGGNENLTFNNPGTSTNWAGGVFTIGDIRPGRALYHDGIVDDVRLYNRILSANEVAELYRMNTASVVDTTDARATAP